MIRITDHGARLANEAVLLTRQIKMGLEAPSRRRSDTVIDDSGVAAATLAAALISTFGNSLLERSLFEEVDDDEIAAADMTPAVG